MNNNPVDIFNNFLKKERSTSDQIRQVLYSELTLENIGSLKYITNYIGAVADITYEKALVVTHENFTTFNRGCPRHSYLIAIVKDIVNEENTEMAEHFLVLEVLDVAPTPTHNETQHTKYEWIKKNAPELDPYTKSDLTWSVLNCKLVGSFYLDPIHKNQFIFSHDIKLLQSSIAYKVFNPSKEILDIIVNNDFYNGSFNEEDRINIGEYRPTENMSLLFKNEGNYSYPDVYIDLNNLKGCRTALFGKTRLGKSNTVKLILKNFLSKNHIKIGQLVFDINGEYANDNPQDGNTSIKSMFPNDCLVYAIKPREGKENKTKLLKLNFYDYPKIGMQILREMLVKDGVNSQNAVGFYMVDMPSKIEAQKESNPILSIKMKNKILLYWAILDKAGFKIKYNPKTNYKLNLLPYITNQYKGVKKAIFDMEDLKKEITSISKKLFQDKAEIVDEDGLPFFDSDEKALIEFCSPMNSAGGTKVITKFKDYHDPNASNFMIDIEKQLLDNKTVILDLGNANEDVRKYFCDMLCKVIFSMQENRFTANNLDNNYIQIYFEEAHNLFPQDNKNVSDIYSKIAKEGAKFNIGMVYSTQSPSTINKELLAQTENFFIGHISSMQEIKSLVSVEDHFSGHEDAISRIKTKGYMRVFTRTHRFIIPVQIKKFNESEEV